MKKFDGIHIKTTICDWIKIIQDFYAVHIGRLNTFDDIFGINNILIKKKAMVIININRNCEFFSEIDVLFFQIFSLEPLWKFGNKNSIKKWSNKNMTLWILYVYYNYIFVGNYFDWFNYLV